MVVPLHCLTIMIDFLKIRLHGGHLEAGHTQALIMANCTFKLLYVAFSFSQYSWHLAQHTVVVSKGRTCAESFTTMTSVKESNPISSCILYWYADYMDKVRSTVSANHPPTFHRPLDSYFLKSEYIMVHFYWTHLQIRNTEEN